MKLTNIERLVLACSVVGAAWSGTVLARPGQADPCQGTTGWNYGGYNCGCASVPPGTEVTFAQCVACCRLAEEQLLLNAAELTCCIAFCNQATFPCQG